MGDLISRKAIVNEISYKFGLGDSIISNAVQIIKNHPTAFDVEEVIQQLEEKIFSYESCVETTIKEIDKNPQNASTFEVCSLHNNRGYLSGLKRALEIVKSGGVDVGEKGGI